MENAGNKASADPENDSTRDSGDESEDEEILEESPCGRWQKRREEVLVLLLYMFLSLCHVLINYFASCNYT